MAETSTYTVRSQVRAAQLYMSCKCACRRPFCTMAEGAVSGGTHGAGRCGSLGQSPSAAPPTLLRNRVRAGVPSSSLPMSARLRTATRGEGGHPGRVNPGTGATHEGLIE